MAHISSRKDLFLSVPFIGMLVFGFYLYCLFGASAAYRDRVPHYDLYLTGAGVMTALFGFAFICNVASYVLHRILHYATVGRGN